MKAVLEAAKLPRHFSPHAPRHTFATLALDAGKSVYYVSKMLGHKDINLTAGTYTRNVDANQAGALDSLDPAGLSALCPICDHEGENGDRMAAEPCGGTADGFLRTRLLCRRWRLVFPRSTSSNVA